MVGCNLEQYGRRFKQSVRWKISQRRIVDFNLTSNCSVKWENSSSSLVITSSASQRPTALAVTSSSDTSKYIPCFYYYHQCCYPTSETGHSDFYVTRFHNQHLAVHVHGVAVLGCCAWRWRKARYWPSLMKVIRNECLCQDISCCHWIDRLDGVTSPLPRTLCSICADRATGKHYGASSCDKGLLRRSNLLTASRKWSSCFKLSPIVETRIIIEEGRPRKR